VRNAAEPAIRRGFHLYWRMSRGLTLGVRGLVVDEAGRIFLVKHTMCAAGTCPAAASSPARPCSTPWRANSGEEGNIDLIEPPALHAVYFNTRVSRRDHVALFVIGAFRQPGTTGPGSRDHGPAFFAPDALPGGTVASVRARVAEVLMGAPLSQRW
jgi:hypothetical protein